MKLARICHGGRGNCAGGIGRVRKGVASGRTGAWPSRIVVVVIVRNVTSSMSGGGVCVGCVRWVIDAIVDGTEDCARVRLAIVDSAVWVGVERGGMRGEMTPTMPKVIPTAALFAKKPLEAAPAVFVADIVDVRPLGVRRELVDKVLLDGEDVVLLEEGVDEEVDVDVVDVVDVVVSEGLGVDDDSDEDVEDLLDGETGVKEVGEETGVELVDFDLTDEDWVESEEVGEGVELGVEEELSEDSALR
ncbi:hypothetical protein BJY52DRAFT_1220056 [Lactarius psammicola]|nr:hypothetical protein BJY52DRAFT_1220056 [Lactarius psammicola]